MSLVITEKRQQGKQVNYRDRAGIAIEQANIYLNLGRAGDFSIVDFSWVW
ncbi:hypothetical protein IQ270_28665 [Microcoleus sp. LEGE 07076]|nr:hypothetical protein [Microcoleus sp. LEGE 07076]MBE9188500.1 hypothetical protein [Microcoleus sp. LEGE 07076]